MTTTLSLLFDVALVTLLSGNSSEFWGLSLRHMLILLAAILFLVDIFINSDIPTHVAYIILSYVIASLFPVHVLYQILFGIIAWFCLVFFHYAIWKTTIQKFVHTVVAPDRYKAGGEALIGKTGIIRDIDGKSLVQVDGDLRPFDCERQVETEEEVTIESVRGSRLFVRPKRKDG